jgi:hypothetical protein
LTRIKRHNCVRILSLLRGRYAPAAGRLAAAISTISARRRRTREGAERNGEDNDRIETGSLRKSGEKSRKIKVYAGKWSRRRVLSRHGRK